jgi:outer membrane protein assembly factor BamB
MQLPRLCLLAALLSAACHPDSVRGLSAPDVSAPASLDFGAVPVGVRRTLPLTLSNLGTAKLALAAASAQAPFSVDSAPAVLELGADGSLQVSFAPTAAGPFQQALALSLPAAATRSLTIQLTGSGVLAAPGLVVLPAQLDFEAHLPAAPPAQPLTLTNNSDQKLAWTAATDASELSLSATSGSLDAHQSTPLSVALTVPAIPADLTRHLTFSAPSLTPLVVPVNLQYLQGGAAFAVEPGTLTLSSQIPAQPVPQPFHLRNLGTVAVHWRLDLTRATTLLVAPVSGVLEAGASADVTVTAPPPPPLPTEIFHEIVVDTQEAGTRTLPISIQYGPPPPPAQYGKSVWPRFHQGNGCTGLSSVFTHTTGKLRFAAPFGPARMQPYEGTYVGSPALADDGTIYQLGGKTGAGALVALEPVHGRVLWKTAITPPGAGSSTSIEATPTVVASGEIFVMTGSEDSSATHFFKLSRAGSVLWQDAGGYMDGFDSSPALGADGTLYLAYDDSPSVLLFSQGGPLPHELARISLDDHSQRTHLETQSAAIADDGTSYWAANGLLWSVSQTSLLWRHDGNDAVAPGISSRSAPALAADGHIVFAFALTDASGKVETVVTAVDPQGLRLWQRKLGPTAPVVSIGPGDVDTLANRVGLSSPALGPDGTVYIGHADGLYALAGADGALKWHAGELATSAPPAVGADGAVFFGAADGRLSAVGPDGKPLWSVQTGGQVNSSPAIGADGAVFAASDDGLLYGVQ